MSSMPPGSQGEGLECACVDNDDLSEHVYCVAIAFKMTEQLEQQICIKFCVKLEHSRETIWMIQKATAMGNR